ncbi:hypothetical protein FIBSPDRAFT_853043 [Athelia psychrophila]|uniref:Uncharacterized protein n=1 Tax=Athelia psychrophila TaxID=1759441 RepID=A0A166R3J9_9AGAM|nr:hypothetical protein FIBSPDRAFT_877892 [Fibularhizoctonia sp. CBS 109695]KZP27863.1 hypothetical protein FIBSPDRAFT_853043 [Fibularhizoctonia sp. CBS 109695]
MSTLSMLLPVTPFTTFAFVSFGSLLIYMSFLLLGLVRNTLASFVPQPGVLSQRG